MHVSLPGSWITAAIEAEWGQRFSVCLGLMYWQETCKQSKASALFQPESAAQQPSIQLTFSWSLYKPPTMMMTHAAKVAKQSWTMHYYKKGKTKTLCRKMLLTVQVQTPIWGYKMSCCGMRVWKRHALHSTACPWCSGAFVTTKTQEAHRAQACLEGEGRDWTSGKELSESPMTPKWHQ